MFNFNRQIQTQQSPSWLPGLVLLSSLLVKIPAFSQPLVGTFASYQTVNAMMASMMKGPWMSYLVPKTFMIMDNQPAMHLLYYPFGALAAALGKGFLGGSIDFWGRLQAALFMFGSGLLVHRISRDHIQEEMACVAALIFSFSPMVMVSGVSFQNEAAAVFFLLYAYWLLLQEADWKKIAAGIFFSLSLAARLHFIMVLPAFIMLCRQDRYPVKTTFFFLYAAATPVLAWFGFAYYLEKHHPLQVVTSLFSQAFEGRILSTALLLRPDFYQRVAETITAHWLTPLLFPFLVLGLMSWNKKTAPLLVWIAGCLLTAVILPKKVFDHPFYLIACLPPVAMLAAPVIQGMLANYSVKARACFWALFLLLAMRYYAPPALMIPEPERAIPAIGTWVKFMTEPKDRVIAWHGTSCDLLYYCQRYGWFFGLDAGANPYHRILKKGTEDPVTLLEAFRAQGARYLVVADKQELESRPKLHEHVTRKYRSIGSAFDAALVFDLTKKP